MRKRTRIGFAVVVAVTALASVSFGGRADAATVEVDTSESTLSAGFNQGWWTATGPSNVDTNDNYLVGVHDGAAFRDFFTFDLRLVPEELTVVGATLRVHVGFSNAGDATETIALFDVSTGAAQLNANNGADAAIFNDLGTGRLYGTLEVARGLVNTIVSVPLNAAAVTDINASRAGFFSIGGALTSLSGRSEEFLFGGTAGQAVRLSVEALPLPRRRADCKNGGWRTLTDARGVPFANQGLCVLFVLRNQ